MAAGCGAKIARKVLKLTSRAAQVAVVWYMSPSFGRMEVERWPRKH
jgi:hypothetical protein